MVPLIDTHTHLEQVADIDEALQRAQQEGVRAIIAMGMNLLSNWQVLQLAKDFPGLVYPALGIHPWAIDEEELQDAFYFIDENIDNCVAVGEAGLDYWIRKDKRLQREVLRRLLHVALEHEKPISTHSRGSYEDLFQLVKEYHIKQAVFHWYSGPLEIVEKIIESGYFISATPALTYSEKHKAVIERVPLENLLLETDCPVKYQGITSEPATIRVALNEVAKLKGLDPQVVARTTTENAIRLFGLEEQVSGTDT
jgi:TatD DNase family protein